MRGFALALALVVTLLGGCGVGDAPSPQPVTPVASPTPTPGVLRTPPGIFLLPGQRGTYAHEQLVALYADGFPPRSPVLLHVISSAENRLMFSWNGSADVTGKVLALVPVLAPETGYPFALPQGGYTLEVEGKSHKAVFHVEVGERPRTYDVVGCHGWPLRVQPGEEAVLFCVGQVGERYIVRGSDGTVFEPEGDQGGLWVYLYQPERTITWWIDGPETYQVTISVEEE